MVPKLILDIFCVPCTPGGCALFWEWKFIPKKAWPQEIYRGQIWVQPPVGTTHGDPGSCWQDFFHDPVPEKNTPLGNLFSPNFGISKVQGGCPMEKYSAALATKEKIRKV